MSAIAGKVALVTGAASGIGLRYAKELLRNGLKAVTIADISEEKGLQAVKEITTEFGDNRVLSVPTDVANRKQFEDAFKKTVDTFKQLDIVINNAGIMNDKIWERQNLININGVIHGSFLALEEYLPKYRSGKEGVLVNVASVLGVDVLPSLPFYTGTKFAVVGISRALGSEEHYKRKQVRVLTLCPGITETPLISDFSEDRVILPEYFKFLPKDDPSQSADVVAEALVRVIHEGTNGSVWIIQGAEPPYQVDFLKRRHKA